MNELSNFILVLDGSAAIFMIGVLLYGIDFTGLKNALQQNRSHNRLIASAAAMLTAACMLSPALADNQDSAVQPKAHVKHSKHVLIGHVAPKDQTVDTSAAKDNYKNYKENSFDTDVQIGAY